MSSLRPLCPLSIVLGLKAMADIVQKTAGAFGLKEGNETDTYLRVGHGVFCYWGGADGCGWVLVLNIGSSVC